MRQEAIKILEENTGNNFFDIVHNNFFLDMSPDARETKAKINGTTFKKCKSFCTEKETTNETKRQSME